MQQYFLTSYESVLIYDINEDLKENKYVQKVNKAVSSNVIKHKVFDLLYLDNPIDEILERMEKLFFTNTISINSINHLKMKKKNLEN